MLNVNTLESFKTYDKAALIKKAGQRLWRDMCSGAAESDPSLLSTFLLLAHGDLKQFRFHYWFAFPALKPPAPIGLSAPARPLAQALPAALATRIAAACDAWRGITPPGPGACAVGHGPPAHAWLLHCTGSGAPTASTASASTALSAAEELAAAAAADDDGGSVEARPLSDWHALAAAGGDGAADSQQRVLLAVSDPSNLPLHPGWLLRNVLLMAALRWGVARLQVVCVRDSRGRTDPARSLLLDVDLAPLVAALHAQAAAAAVDEGAAAAVQAGPLPVQLLPVPDAVGWEANAQGTPGPRVQDLSFLMSPHRLADQAVDLNLRLMRWRAAPDLDTAAVGRAKCLLLGAGTLGCAVSRVLLAWGCRHVTFVDSGRVSYSNPVRQSLFEFTDCVDGGKPKAEAAAAALQRIFPSVVSAGHSLVIPMPGHPPPNAAAEEALKQAAEALDSLVRSHDVVFLLTDTRESRWLPSLLAAAHGRIAITAAIGFDGFVVMRHGPSPELTNAPSPRLGCYFCNDVVAPLNSTNNRALDQQCTVARPGLAPIASALAVELMAALLQHPQGAAAPPPPLPGSTTSAPAAAGPPAALGPAPHMIRGALNGFSQTCMQGCAFGQCTACSATVVEAYRADGWGVVRRAVKEPSYLEDLTGLSALYAATDLANLAASDEDDDDDDDEGDGDATGASAAGDAQGGGDAAGGKGGSASSGDGAAQGLQQSAPQKQASGGEDGSEEPDDWTEL